MVWDAGRLLETGCPEGYQLDINTSRVNSHTKYCLLGQNKAVKGAIGGCSLCMYSFFAS